MKSTPKRGENDLWETIGTKDGKWYVHGRKSLSSDPGAF